MASGHVSRIKRPNTWLHGPMLQNVKKALANTEPSTHGAKWSFTLMRCCFAKGPSGLVRDLYVTISSTEYRFFSLHREHGYSPTHCLVRHTASHGL
jgi:hypothetical protein